MQENGKCEQLELKNVRPKMVGFNVSNEIGHWRNKHMCVHAHTQPHPYKGLYRLYGDLVNCLKCESELNVKMLIIYFINKSN